MIEAPTLLIWGEHDVAQDKATTVGTGAWVRDLTVRYLPDAGHWVQQEAPEAVNAILEAWLTGRPVPEAWELEAPAALRSRRSDRGRRGRARAGALPP
ncbi:MAG: alpha/beta hydrolase [Sandaracinaceae bacterium]|nr:alpha/beta hydrolase [Sandaracinaceae bacterium]